MKLIDTSIKEEIIFNLEKILNINDEHWNKIDDNVKIKMIHHFCNFLNKENKLNLSNNLLSIPLKSLKAKKIIQIAGINKLNNKNLYNNFNLKILDFTFQFRNNFLNKKKIYYVFSNMPKSLYNSILEEYNKIIYDFIIDNISYINSTILYEGLVSNNTDKLITNFYPKSFKIFNLGSGLKIEFDNNIQIICELFYFSDKITNNIPVKYKNKLINIF